MEFKGRTKAHIRLNIAPLIDVVFLLLIFVMLSSHFVSQPGIKISLPEASTAKLHQQEDIVIYITEDSRLYLNEAEISLTELPERLKMKIAAAEKKTVIIKADEKIDLGLAVKVMDIAQQARTEGLVISTKIGKKDD